MHARALSTFRFSANTCIPQAQPKAQGAVTEQSPGIEVMTDLASVKAATIDPHISLDQAEQSMIYQGVRSLFVVSGYPCVDGLITLADLVGEKPMRQINERHIRRQDLSVADVMTPLAMLDALDFKELTTSTVAQVIATFKLKHSHLVVVQAATQQDPARIRGVISLTQLERQLGRALPEAMPHP